MRALVSEGVSVSERGVRAGDANKTALCPWCSSESYTCPLGYGSFCLEGNTHALPLPTLFMCTLYKQDTTATLHSDFTASYYELCCLPACPVLASCVDIVRTGPGRQLQHHVRRGWLAGLGSVDLGGKAGQGKDTHNPLPRAGTTMHDGWALVPPVDTGDAPWGLGLHSSRSAAYA